MRRLLIPLGSLILAACGGSAISPRTASASQALTGNAEALEFETPSTRHDLFRDIARTSQLQAGRKVTGPVFFPIVHEGEVVAAPGLEARSDLLQAADAGQALQLTFDGRGERWSEDRRDSLGGLSEREAVDLVARSLLSHWGISSSSIIQVDRSPGAPYAAAYVDGILRVNPAFLYLSAAPVVSSSPAPVQ